MVGSGVSMYRLGFTNPLAVFRARATRLCCCVQRMAISASISTETRTTAYRDLCERLQEVSYLGGCAGLLGWDEQVMLPEGGMLARGKQKAALAACLHDKRSDEKLGMLITAAEAEVDALSPMEAANVRDARRDYDK